MTNVSAILKAIQHPTRQLILNKIHENEIRVTHSELLPLCENSNGKLNYHLLILEGIITKHDDGYSLTETGEKIVLWLENLVSMGEKFDKTGDRSSV